jgi:DNA repair protein RadC
MPVRARNSSRAAHPAALSDVELLALLLRTGIKGKGVLQWRTNCCTSKVIAHCTVRRGL